MRRYAWIVISCLLLSSLLHLSSPGIVIYIPFPSPNRLFNRPNRILNRPNRMIRSMRILLRMGRVIRRLNTARRIISLTRGAVCNQRIFCEASSYVTRNSPDGGLRIIISLSNPIFCRAQHRECPDRGLPMMQTTNKLNILGGLS